MAALAEQTRIREVTNERGERVIIEEKDQVVTVELEPGVYAARVQKQTAVVIAAGSPEPATCIVTVDIEPDERTCCQRAWHCDRGSWYSPRGKGLAWVPLYIILWLPLMALGSPFLVMFLPLLAPLACIHICCDDD